MEAKRRVEAVTEGKRRNAALAAVVLAFCSNAGSTERAELVHPEESDGRPRNKSGKESYLQINSVADVFSSTTPHEGSWHLGGAVSLWTSDYYRARYGGVPADLDYLSYRILLNGTVELIDQTSGAGSLSALSLSFGTANFFTDSPAPDADAWYTSDRYIGLAAGFANGWQAGVSYTVYKNPDSPAGTPKDVAITFSYAGEHALASLQPQFKAVKAVGSSSGYLLQTSITPAFKPFDSSDVTIATPIDLGAGFDDYHGTDVDEGYYVELGVLATLPLQLNLPGRWALSGGTYLTWRSQSIVDATEVYDDAGTFVPTALLSLTFTY